MDKIDQAETVVSRVLVQNEKAEAPQRNLLDRVGVLLALLELYIAWGLGYLGFRLALESIPVFLMSGIRYVLAGGILYGYLRARRVPNPSKAEWRGAAIVGLLILAIGSGGVAFAEQWIATGLAAVAVGAVPLWVALFLGFTGDWPTPLEWLGLLLGFVGIVLLNLEHGMWATPLGTIALVLAPMCWALGSALSTHLRLPLPAGLMGGECCANASCWRCAAHHESALARAGVSPPHATFARSSGLPDRLRLTSCLPCLWLLTA